MCVCMCVHVDFPLFLPAMVNKVEYIWLLFADVNELSVSDNEDEADVKS